MIHRPHGCQETPQYLNSPVAAVVDGAETVRRRLEGGAAEPGFPVLEGLRAEGATDYAAMPVAFSDGLVTVVTWASDRPGGFTAAELRRLDDLLPALGAVLEARAVRRIATTVLDTYVGHAAGERILRGEIRRGDGAAFHAPLWYCDMRGFTMLSETLPRDELLALLDEYFERVIAPVAAHGGEVLKFIGDSVLAAFPAAEGVSRRAACRSALAAAEGALAGMAGLNRERAAAGTCARGRVGPARRRGGVRQRGDAGAARLHRDRPGGQPDLPPGEALPAARAHPPALAGFRPRLRAAVALAGASPPPWRGRAAGGVRLASGRDRRQTSGRHPRAGRSRPSTAAGAPWNESLRVTFPAARGVQQYSRPQDAVM